MTPLYLQSLWHWEQFQRKIKHFTDWGFLNIFLSVQWPVWSERCNVKASKHRMLQVQPVCWNAWCAPNHASAGGTIADESNAVIGCWGSNTKALDQWEQRAQTVRSDVPVSAVTTQQVHNSPVEGLTGPVCVVNSEGESWERSCGKMLLKPQDLSSQIYLQSYRGRIKVKW